MCRVTGREKPFSVISSTLPPDESVYLRKYPLRDEDLPVARSVAEASRKVRDGSDRCIVVASLEANPPQRGVPLRNANPEAEHVAMPSPAECNVGDAIAHLDCHPDGACRPIRTRDRIIEEDHQPVAGESLQRPLVLEDELAQGGVILAQNAHRVFRLNGLGEGCEAAQVAEDDGDLTTVTLEDRFVAFRDDEVGNRRRQKSPESPDPLDLSHLRLDPLLQLLVPFGELAARELELVEQSRVLNRERGLARKGLDQIDNFR